MRKLAWHSMTKPWHKLQYLNFKEKWNILSWLPCWSEVDCEQSLIFLCKVTIVGFHMTSLKLSILLRFYFHGVLEQLKTNFQTNFRSKRVLGFVIKYAWISKLLRDAAGNLDGDVFRGDGNFNRTWRHDLCNIAHALAHHIAVVLPSATWNWSVWCCGENVSI